MLTGLLVREPMPAYGKLRVYADTSVIGGCEDDEFRGPSRRLIDQCARGEMTLVVSSVTERELATAPRAVREVIGALGDLPEVRRIRQYSEANRRMGCGQWMREGMGRKEAHPASCTIPGDSGRF